MRNPIRITAAIAALTLAVAIAPAHSGPYRIETAQGSVALVGLTADDPANPQLTYVDLADGSRAFAFLVQVEEGDVQGNFFFPDPARNPNYSVPMPKRFYGCIFIKKGAEADVGCALQPPSFIEVDPALQETTVVFSVRSFLPDGFRLTANVVLEGVGNVVPLAEHGLHHRMDDENRPDLVVAQGTALLARSAIARGSIRSDIIDGGAIVAHDSADSLMGQGLFRAFQFGSGEVRLTPGVNVDFDFNEPFCFGSDDPPGPFPHTCYPEDLPLP